MAEDEFERAWLGRGHLLKTELAEHPKRWLEMLERVRDSDICASLPCGLDQRASRIGSQSAPLPRGNHRVADLDSAIGRRPLIAHCAHQDRRHRCREQDVIEPPSCRARPRELLAPELERLRVVMLRRPVARDDRSEELGEPVATVELGGDHRRRCRNQAQPRRRECEPGLFVAHGLYDRIKEDLPLA